MSSNGFYETRARVVLGSASPRRRELLALAGISFESLATDVPEQPLDGEAPVELATRLARSKARAASLTVPGSVAIGADTIVVLDGAVLGKPRDGDQAARMLRTLAGRTHEVLTAFAVAREDALLAGDCVRTEVEFRALDEAQARTYVATGEPMDKAGAYGIQGLGALFVRAIRGSYTNVVGLPLVELLEALVRLGAITPRGAIATGRDRS